MAKTQWKYGLKGVRSVRQRCPVITHQSVLATFNYGQGSNLRATLCALDLETGNEKWRFDAKLILNEPCVSPDGYIFTTCFDGSVTKLQPDGTVCWQIRPSACNLGIGLIGENKFFYAEIAGSAKYTRALNIEDGSIAWEYESGGHAYALANSGSEHIVYCSVAGRSNEKQIYLHCLYKNSGRVIWKSQYEQYLFQPLIIEDYIVISSRSHIAVFDLESGQLLSKHDIEEGVAVIAKPIATNNDPEKTSIILLTENARLFCLDIAVSQQTLSGQKTVQIEQRWSRHFPCGIKAKTVLHNEVLLTITEDGNLLKINYDTGDTIDRVKLPGFKQGYGIAPIGNDAILSVSRDCSRLKNVS